MTEIDDSQVNELFAALDVEDRKNILTDALKEGGKVLLNRTKSNLRATPINSDNLTKGIKMKIDKAYGEVIVHIMGDYRLKFFEKGTKLRKTKKGAIRGLIKPHYFFKNARDSESEITDAVHNSITNALNKIDK